MLNIIKSFNKNSIQVNLKYGNNQIGNSVFSITKDNKAIINNLFIDKQYRRNNYGSYLLKNTEEIIKKDSSINFINLIAWKHSENEYLLDFFYKNNYKKFKNKYILFFFDK